MKVGAKITVFNAAMRTRRLEMGLSQTELGRMVGVGQATIGDIELLKKRRPTPTLKATLERIADALDSPIEEIFPADYLEALEANTLPGRSSYILIRDVRLDQLGPGIRDDLLLPGPEAIVDHEIMLEDVREALEQIPEREREIIKAYYGFDGGEPKHMGEVGRDYQITRERVRQILAMGLSRLRNPAIRHKLKDYKIHRSSWDDN